MPVKPRSCDYVWAGVEPFTGEQVITLFDENENLRRTVFLLQTIVNQVTPTKGDSKMVKKATLKTKKNLTTKRIITKKAK